MRPVPRILLSLAAIAALTQVPAASAQEDERGYRPPGPAEAIIYRDINYQGPAVNVSRADPTLNLAWPVNAIRVRSGRWELCERPNFRGDCRTVERDTLRLGTLLRGIVVQSMRPVGGGGGGGSGPGEPGNNPSLRGMAAEFYPAPAVNRRRVLACTSDNATANCAALTADDFCRRAGWTGSARQAMETVNRRVYLADVLCTRTGS